MKGFIEILDVKGVVHHFRLDDLRSYRDGYFHYEPQGGFITHMKVADIKDCIENVALASTPPSPDALVEAVKGAVKGMAYIIKNPAHLEDNIRHWHDKLDNALADHEKAVSSGT